MLFVSLIVVGVVCGSGTDHIDRRTVASLDLERYMGGWYEIARFDHSFERGLDHVKAQYGLRSDGRIAVINSGVNEKGRTKIAHGKAHTASVPGRLRVSFFWFFYSDYNVMELDENYQWVLVGSKSPKYLWILSRTPSLPVSTLNHILDLAHKRGYPIDRLIYVDQGGADITR